MVSAWRIVKQKHKRSALSGEGARRFGGRWNSPGVSVVYLAQSQALAALEMLVHLDAAELLRSYVIIEVGIDEVFHLARRPSALGEKLEVRSTPSETQGNW